MPKHTNNLRINEMNKLKKLLLSLSITTIILGGMACSKEDSANQVDNHGTPNLSDAISSKGKEQAAIAAMPQGNADTPLNQYKELTSDNDIMFAYYALSSIPVDYDKVLISYSEDYRRASDEFKKQDILNALKPKIDQEIAAAKNARYLKMTWNGFRLNKYDFPAKGFPQDSLGNNSNLGWDNYGYRLAFTNGDNYKLFKVEDEAKARLIEEKRSKHEQFDLVVYVYAQDADLNNKSVKTQVMHVSLIDSRGNELFAQ